MLITATQLGVGRNDDRWSGFTGPAGVALYGGLCVSQNPTVDPTGETLQLSGVVGSQGIYNTAVPVMLGLAWELTGLPSGPSGAGVIVSAPNQGGLGYDTINSAFGGIYSIFHRPGNAVDVVDGQENLNQVTVNKNGGSTVTQNASCPFVSTDAFVIGSPIYHTDKGLLTITLPGTGGATYAQAGFCRAITGTGDAQRITVELEKHLWVHA